MMIDERTSRADLLAAIYGEPSLFDVFLDRKLDPEKMDTDAIRAVVIEWITAGDETGAA